jgi:uncharacterized protein YrrD
LEIESQRGTHVFDLQTEKYLGKIAYPIIDYEARKVLGFIFKRAFYYPRKVFEFSSIREAHKDFIIIDKAKAKLFWRKRKLRKAFNKQRAVITLKLVEGDEQVGKVFDFVVDDKTGAIEVLLAERSLFSEVFRIPISKVQRFDVDAYILEEEAVPREVKGKPGMLSRALTGAAGRIGNAVKQSKIYYDQGQKNLLIGQQSPCEILSDSGKVIVRKDQKITKEILAQLEEERKTGELSAAVVGSGIGTRYKSYRDKKKALKKNQNKE